MTWALNVIGIISETKILGKNSGSSFRLDLDDIFTLQSRFFGFWVKSAGLVRASIAATKLHDQKASLRGKGLFCFILPDHSLSLKEVRTGIPMAEAGNEWRSLRGAAYWLASYGLLSLLS